VIQHLEREGPGLFAQAAQGHGLDLEVSRMDLGDPLPEPIDGDGLLIMGGPMGVADINDPAYPWLPAEVELIRRSLEDGIPLIGVCLGAQLIAHASGGGVEVLLGGVPLRPLPEVGWAPIQLTSAALADPLMHGLPKRFDVLHWHGDRILLPEGARLLARSARCDEQLFRIGSRACGLQFHVEVDPQTLGRWLIEDSAFIQEALGDEGPQQIRNQQRRCGESARQVGEDLLHRLLTVLW